MAGYINQHQVSLRGASAKEISRDDLLQRVSQERELRNYTRRATAAALFIQRVWRSYNSTKMTALQLQRDWEKLINDTYNLSTITNTWISNTLLRPFLFFTTCLSIRYRKIYARDVDSMQTCFRILLESLNSTDSQKNFCTPSTLSHEERRIWLYQAKKLISLCLLILSECDYTRQGANKFVLLTSQAMRFLVILTDVKGWKNTSEGNFLAINNTVKGLIQFMGSSKSKLYICVRRYISRLDAPFIQMNGSGQKDNKVLITASAMTLSLRPFHIWDIEKDGSADMQNTSEQFLIFLLTIPWFAQRLPAFLLTSLRHKSILTPCFRALLISKERILKEIAEVDSLVITSSSRMMPAVGWALGNVLFLSSDSGHMFDGHGKFTQDLDYTLYIHVAIVLAENLLSCLEKVEFKKVNQECHGNNEESNELVETTLIDASSINLSSEISYIDYFKPICQQWHLIKLLTFGNDITLPVIQRPPRDFSVFHGKWDLLDVAYYFFCMLKIFSALSPVVGSLPVLNMLAFTPGFLLKLWEALEKSYFPNKNPEAGSCVSKPSENNSGKILEKKQRQGAKDAGNKWLHVLHKITGKSNADCDNMNTNDIPTTDQIDEGSMYSWDVETLKCGPEGLSKSACCLFHLFCATYSHLLLVLDDIEFYEKQVPFTLEQQRKIAAMLNTLVYNALSHSISQHNKTLMDAAVRCLHLLYERDCRHQYCPPSLWLSPARNNRPPIAVAAITRGVLSTTPKVDDSLAVLSSYSVITTTPHVFPFKERVQMFREFVSMDKVSLRMAGQVVGPGAQAVEIVIRRGHIVEDGFQQLNCLGSRLKSSIHVSFVSECGLPEAGLDYGGLSKEFLTDIAKAAFSPDYGLFSQTSTSDRLLIPNTAARFLDNGIQMIEFLGRIVGKALYEGILLDYSFSHVFVQKLLGRYSFLDELSTLDPELYRNLMYVKHYDGDVKELFLDFTVTEEAFGKRQIIELKPGGKDVSVTNENKLQYIHAIADFKLNRQVLYLSNAFYRGLTDLISPSWLKLFNANEFNQLLSGGNHDIDIDDLQKNTRYTGGYTEGSRTIKLFWQVMTGFEPDERCMLLKFVTSCSRAPLLGFKHLQPTFTIHKVAGDMPLWATIGGQDLERLPSSSTCYNTLKLPSYKRSSTLRAKLLYAIKSNAGFELS